MEDTRQYHPESSPFQICLSAHLAELRDNILVEHQAALLHAVEAERVTTRALQERVRYLEQYVASFRTEQDDFHTDDTVALNANALSTLPYTPLDQDSLGIRSGHTASESLWPHSMALQFLPVFWSRVAHYTYITITLSIAIYYVCLFSYPPDCVKVALFDEVGIAKRQVLLLLSLPVTGMAFLLHQARALVKSKEIIDISRATYEDSNARQSFQIWFRRGIVFTAVLIIGVTCAGFVFSQYILTKEVGRCAPFYLLPLFYFACWPTLVAMLAIYAVYVFCRNEVAVLSKELDPERVSQMVVPRDFWIQMALKHRSLDRRLKQVWLRASPTMVLALSLMITMTFLFTTTAFLVRATEDSDYHTARVTFKAALFSLTFLCVLISLCLLYPLATITSQCQSTVGTSESLRTLALQHFGGRTMSMETCLHYVAFVQYLNSVRTGVYIRVIGFVSMSHLVWWARIAIPVVPIAITSAVALLNT